MKKLHFSILIDAPKENVWHMMLDEEPYKMWTSAFNPGGHYIGDWSKDSKMTFLGPDPETGEEGGMVAKIAENRPYEFISIQYVGMVKSGVEDIESKDAKKWSDGHENYTFVENNGRTEVQIDIDVPDEYVEMFNEMWVRALQKLKENTENEQ